MPGGQVLHNVPCPGSCGRGRRLQGLKPGQKPWDIQAEAFPLPSGIIPGQDSTSLTRSGSLPGGHSQGVIGVGVARGQGSSWKNAGGAEDMVTEEDNVKTWGLQGHLLTTYFLNRVNGRLHRLPTQASGVLLGPASASSAALPVFG